MGIYFLSCFWKKCFFFFFVFFVFLKFNWISQLSQKKWCAKTISKSVCRHRSYSVWTSTCSHSGQTDILQRSSATLPVATYPVSCFPQSVVMRVIPPLQRCVGTILWPCAVTLLRLNTGRLKNTECQQKCVLKKNNFFWGGGVTLT